MGSSCWHLLEHGQRGLGTLYWEVTTASKCDPPCFALAASFTVFNLIGRKEANRSSIVRLNYHINLEK